MKHRSRPGTTTAPVPTTSAAAADESAGTHRSLERGLAVLERLVAAGEALPQAELARRTGLHRSTAHHLVQTLARAGWVELDEETRGCRPGPRLRRLAGHRWRADEMAALAQPLLAELTTATGEGTSVALWADGEVLIVAKQESDGPVRVVQDVGAVRPVHCTAVGKAIAAFLSPAELRALLARMTFERHTARTITSQRAFEVEMRRIRTAGWALDDEENHEGLRCVAMPLFDHAAQVVGSMCVLGPRQRMTQAKLAAVRRALALQARRLSERLGHRASAAGIA